MNLMQETRALPAEIAGLNLDYLARKLLDDDALEAEKRNGEQLWTETRALRAIGEYRQFLALMKWHPEAVLVPSEDIDEVWHLHVLNTSNYFADCERVFGHYQHHFPTLGESEEVMEEHLKGRTETMGLFEAAFGAAPESYGESPYLRCSGRCRRCGRRE